MPVVINEMEIVLAPPEAPMPGAQPPAPPSLAPADIAELMERRARQALRLFAH